MTRQFEFINDEINFLLSSQKDTIGNLHQYLQSNNNSSVVLEKKKWNDNINILYLQWLCNRYHSLTAVASYSFFSAAGVYTFTSYLTSYFFSYFFSSFFSFFGFFFSTRKGTLATGSTMKNLLVLVKYSLIWGRFWICLYHLKRLLYCSFCSSERSITLS